MAKIILDDWTEKEVAESDIIMREDLEKDYVSKEDYDSLQAKYEKKKAQAKDAFKEKDLVTKEAIEKEREAIRESLKEETKFAMQHWFDEIPEEVKEFKNQHSDLSWEQAYRASWYEPSQSGNPNPWKANKAVFNWEKKEWSTEDLAGIADDPEKFDSVMAKLESWEYKSV